MRVRSLFLRPADEPISPGLAALHVALVLALLTAVFAWVFQALAYHWDWAGVWHYREKFLRGWLVTLGLAGAALVASTAVGLALALARGSRVLPLRYGARVVVELLRGTPLLVQLLLFFYAVAQTLGVRDRATVGVATLALFSGAYISEIIRAGIESVGRSQLDSARAVGFTRAQTFRHVVFPQALRQMLPPLAGQFASLVKDSSLLSVLALGEFTLSAQEVAAFTYSPFESYAPLALGYLAITLPISLAARRLEARSRYET